jgi:hypothetical protein
MIRPDAYFCRSEKRREKRKEGTRGSDVIETPRLGTLKMDEVKKREKKNEIRMGVGGI